MKLLQVCLLTAVLSACSSIAPKTEPASEDNIAGIAPGQPVSDTAPTLQAEPVPEEEFTEPLAPATSWDRVVRNFGLELDTSNSRVKRHMDWYIRHPRHLEQVSDRARRYLHYIASEVERREIPGELALLPVVESAFDPFAYSHGRASGVWQFIPSTGRAYGLHQDWWHDGRRDIRSATNAALNYLEYLAGRFDGDWMLALASYNSGAGTVRKAIRKNKRKGLDTDFWSLDLPKETRAYVPKLVAISYLLKHREDYDIAWRDIEDAPYFAIVPTGGQIDLSQVAELADTDLDEIYRLNPQFNRWATHPDGPHEVLIPATQEFIYRENLANLDENSRLKWQRYVVRSGDSLITIARKHNITAEVVRSANQLKSDTIYAGQQLLIPSALKAGGEYGLSLSERLTRKQNAGQTANRSQRVDYRVKNGDSFWKIARMYDTSVNKLSRWNGMAPGDPLRVGQKLTIWTTESDGQREEVRKVYYKVRSGDNLSTIGSRFNVTVSDIKRWNSSKLGGRYLKPGQNLTLYVDVIR
ncbi:LysM peptidoglycan-binding domain-containing protein [Thalassolituus sp.]|uniref:lytic transglycosylase n=1 Tax=Thalassolituus sp. TaxID=2030822 RepID=UPI00243C659C|nr:LysM peptidoglycan-binding domain-containing protein [Thalassolituus sp.]